MCPVTPRKETDRGLPPTPAPSPEHLSGELAHSKPETKESVPIDDLL